MLYRQKIATQKQRETISNDIKVNLQCNSLPSDFMYIYIYIYIYNIDIGIETYTYRFRQIDRQIDIDKDI